MRRRRLAECGDRKHEYQLQGKDRTNPQNRYGHTLTLDQLSGHNIAAKTYHGRLS